MYAGELGAVARAALRGGVAGACSLSAAARSCRSSRCWRKPLSTWTARSSGSEVEAALEWKVDGARIQLHKRGSEVRIFSRGLNDVTSSLPELVELAAGPARARAGARRRGDRARCGRAAAAVPERRCAASDGGSMSRQLRARCRCTRISSTVCACEEQSLADAADARALAALARRCPQRTGYPRLVDRGHSRGGERVLWRGARREATRA